ncbi:exonuclease subunit SbcD [Sansalvadorimonas verongulae]|uniref:exonuclease subunit SbcD n=1 Tax=Sansalvadorimonas verongulae TaxID=2172824 RepID=UPI0012BC0D1F|nr:exonuclease subunit SbcD [Sansalvadorimonas verongulae]MTI13144.1 exonuclease subunit SbcD [Sansalvadorimonas verongulae]
MRILHTSDWHLGQHFMGKTREQEHRLFIQWLLKTVKEQKVDALVIAGDIFDTGVPPSYARSQYNQFIVDLQQVGHCQLVVLGGNHDSVATLHESRSLLACLNATVIGAASQNPEEQVVILKQQDGSNGAVLCGIPYIRPRDVLVSSVGDSGESKQQALLSAMTDHYKAVYQEAEKLADEHELPIIATGHLTAVGGKLSESVRDIYIGTLSAFPVSAFPPADYIALGHLHRGQTVSGHEHIRYSGSPIPLSFDEASARKQVLLVDFQGHRLKTITPVEVPLFRPLASLKGGLESLPEQLNTLLEDNKDADLEPWIEIVVSGDNWISDFQSQILELTADMPLDVLRVRRQRKERENRLERDERETLAELRVKDVFHRRLELEELNDKTITALTHAFDSVVAEIEEEELQGVVIEKVSTDKKAEVQESAE